MDDRAGILDRHRRFTQQLQIGTDGLLARDPRIGRTGQALPYRQLKIASNELIGPAGCGHDFSDEALELDRIVGHPDQRLLQPFGDGICTTAARLAFLAHILVLNSRAIMPVATTGSIGNGD